MKAGVIFSGTGPILVLTTYASFLDIQFVGKLSAKGIDKSMAFELPVDAVKAKYGTHFEVIVNDVQQTDDLRVLDFNGYTVFHNFPFAQMGEPIYHESQR